MSDTRHTKVLIIGSGPAGYTAGVYASRAMLEPILVQGIEPGGQLTTTTEVENWPGDTEVQGPDLMVRMQDHAKAMGCEIIGDIITDLDTTSRNRSQDDPSMSAVTSDNYAGGRKVAEFLLAAGHRKIGYIAGWEGASTQRDRETGFCERLAEDGLTLHARGVGNFKMETAAEATRQMFTGDRPDAVFVGNDHMAFAVMDVLRFELGLRIPEDVSVVGYDDVPPAAWRAYNLTTIRQRANLMVAETVRAMFEQIDTPDTASPCHVQIEAPLILRGSARIPDDWPTEG